MDLPIRPNVLQMQPYSPGKPIDEVKRELGLSEVVKLASNENPFGPSPRAVEAVRRVAGEMHLYPDGGAYDLRRALSGRFRIDPRRILVGNGSDELIGLLGSILLDDPDDEVLVGDPSFVRYDAAAQITPCRLVKVPLDEEMRHDLAAMRDAITSRTKLVFVANPNNPTGTIVRRPEVEALLDDLPSAALLVLDEAYFEFAAEAEGYPDGLEYVREGRPVVALRTFSKAYGLAGLRLGYGFAPAEVVDAIDRARMPFNVSALAQAAGVAALEDEEHVRQTVKLNAAGLRRLAQLFREAGARPYESFANFVFADLGRPALPVFQELLRRGVVVRPGHIFGTPNCLRVSVGTEAEVERFAEQFRAAMEGVPA